MPALSGFTKFAGNENDVFDFWLGIDFIESSIASRWTNADCTEHLPYRLTDKALDFYDTLPDSIKNDWYKLCQSFQREFPPSLSAQEPYCSIPPFAGGNEPGGFSFLQNKSSFLYWYIQYFRPCRTHDTWKNMTPFEKQATLGKYLLGDALVWCNEHIPPCESKYDPAVVYAENDNDVFQAMLLTLLNKYDPPKEHLSDSSELSTSLSAN